MCGLVGFYPKKGKKVDISKLYNLWIFNEERGTHSCGIVFGEERRVGIGLRSKARDFIKEVSKEIRDYNLTNKPIICHTRHATAGAHTASNAHPFSWFKGKESNYFSFAHNGVIRNLEELKTKLGLKRHKESLMDIDSQVLGLAVFDSLDGLIEEEQIMTNYEGNAAFICYDSNKVFKVWKGANNGVEERPLYYVEVKEGWYFCSMDFPLEVNFLTQPISVPNNTLFTFKDHQLESSVVYNRNIKSTVVETTRNKRYYTDFEDYEGVEYSDLGKLMASDKKVNNVIFESALENIELECYGVDKLRYCQNLDPITGYLHFKEKDNKKLSLTPSNTGQLIRFDSGVALKHMYYTNLCAVFENYHAKSSNFEELFNHLQYVIKHNITDFIPFFDARGQVLVIYYLDGDKISYVTINDKCSLKLPSIFDVEIMIHISNSYISIYNEKYSKN